MAEDGLTMSMPKDDGGEVNTMPKTLLVTMCQGCETELTENGRLKRPLTGYELKNPGTKGICHFCGRKLDADECASLVSLTTAQNER